MTTHPAEWAGSPRRRLFFEQLTTQSSLLMLDYDGTLAPFSADRLRAAPYSGVTHRLEALAGLERVRLALITGRPARELARMLPLGEPLEIWGAHGRERLKPDGRYQLFELSPTQSHALDAIADALARNGGAGPHADLERKPASLAVHWRALPSQDREAVRACVTRLFEECARPAALHLLEFDGGLEIRSEDVNKGSVVDCMLAEFGTGPAAYLGDDTTDEDAFRRLRGRGATILVRPEPRESAAEYWLRPPDELLAFLDDWIAAASSAQKGGPA